MSADPKKLLTAQEYLAQERLAEFRSEYYRGEVFAMARTNLVHALVKSNLAYSCGSQLKDDQGRVLTSDLRVKIDATGLYTYPDIIIICDKPQLEDAERDTLLNPRALVEVLSDSTEKYDRGVKFAHYRQIPSLKEYILVAQDRMLMERYVRQPDESWLLTVFTDANRPFEFVSVPVRVPLAEVYRGVELPAEPGR